MHFNSITYAKVYFYERITIDLKSDDNLLI